MSDRIDPKDSQKAYNAAGKALRMRHPEEFQTCLDAAYADMGIVSPRLRKEERAAAAAAKREQVIANKKARKQKKIDAAVALLRESGIEVQNN